MGRIFFILALVFFCAYSEGCQQHCGILHIPYPFGIGKGCSLEASFDIKCNTSNNPPRAYLATNEEIEIIEITPLQIRVKMFNLVFSSFDLDGRLIDGTNFSHDLSDSAYSFSKDNWFTVIGCTDLGVITYHVYGNTFSTGCISFCTSKNVPGNVASCSGADTGFGNGCCRARIHKGTTILRMQLIDAHKDVRNSSFLHMSNRFFHASYAFVGEKASNESTDVQPRLSDLEVNESKTFMRESWAIKHMPLVVLDWKITGYENCSEAKKNASTYACRAHSDCVNFQTGTEGYLCMCSKGYHGNPYLGCLDVDESWMYDELRR